MYDPVLAWSLGQDLTTRELDAVADLRKKLRTADRRRSRPTIGSPETRLLAYSKPLDLLSAYRFPLSSTLELADYGNWLRERPRLARPGTPLWTVIQTQPSASLRSQWTAFHGAQLNAPLDSDAIRLLALTAIGAGVRGLEFASHSSLEQEDNESRIRALTLALINAELALVEPWAAAGSYVTTADSNDPQVKAVMLEYDRSRLLVATRTAQNAQYVPQHVSGGSVSFVVPGVPESHDLIELTPAGLRPLKTPPRHRRHADHARQLRHGVAGADDARPADGQRPRAASGRGLAAFGTARSRAGGANAGRSRNGRSPPAGARPRRCRVVGAGRRRPRNLGKSRPRAGRRRSQERLRVVAAGAHVAWRAKAQALAARPRLVTVHRRQPLRRRVRHAARALGIDRQPACPPSASQSSGRRRFRKPARRSCRPGGGTCNTRSRA